MKKYNARTGGAVSPLNKEIDFINTGHAAQARYLAALANPFASPAVPIPDSFLEAHVSKIGLESVLAGCEAVTLTFSKTYNENTGDYRVLFKAKQNGVWSDLKLELSEVGSRLVAAGISFEDVGQLDSMEGVVTYSQYDYAYAGTNGPAAEYLTASQRTSRNNGHGTVLYTPATRASLDFEGNSYPMLEIEFSVPRNIILRQAAIVETDGKQGFSEVNASNKNFVITSSYPNHHAGIFADTPMPDFDHSLIDPSHTDLADHNPGHHTTALAAAAHWVSSAAGWAWRHKDAVGRFIQKAPDYYHAMTRFGGSVVSASGRISVLGARAATLAIAA